MDGSQDGTGVPRMSTAATPGRAGRVRRPLSDPMLNYFLEQLDVRLHWMRQQAGADQARLKEIDGVAAELEELRVQLVEAPCTANESWNRAYRIERLLALQEPDEALYGEVQRRLDEATEEGVPSAPRLRATFIGMLPSMVDSTKNPPEVMMEKAPRLRAMLLDILEETHWYLQRKFHIRPIQKSATRRLILVGLVAWALFIAPYIRIYAGTLFDENAWQSLMRHWHFLPLWTAATAGFFGAMFSRLVYIQSNWNVLSLGSVTDARDLSSIFLRGAVGMTGAVVVFYFLQSGVIEGNLFPKMDQVGLVPGPGQAAPSADPLKQPLQLILPNANLALLVVWSFLAGFSERLVPSILQTTETTLRDGPAVRK